PLHDRGAITQIPCPRIRRSDRIKGHGIVQANGEVRNVGTDTHLYPLLEIDLEDSKVAIAGAIDSAPCTRRGGVRTAAPRAHRLVHHTVLVEARGSAIHMLCPCAAEESGIRERLGILVEHHEVEITAIGSRLERIRGHGQPVGAARNDIGGTAPTTEVYL